MGHCCHKVRGANQLPVVILRPIFSTNADFGKRFAAPRLTKTWHNAVQIARWVRGNIGRLQGGQIDTADGDFRDARPIATPQGICP